jgi:mannose-6-phosphate isomerase
VLETDPGAGVFAGLHPGVDRAGLMRALESKTVDRVLRFILVSAGQVVFIPSGRIHAIDAGCLLLEVQQRSNSTYRLYDWDRAGPDGRPRDLQLEQALRAIRWKDDLPVVVLPSPAERNGINECRRIMKAPFFTVEHWRLSGPQTFPAADAGKTFHALFVTVGHLRVEGGGLSECLEAGSSVLLPAELGEAQWIPEALGTEVICVTRP